MPTGYTDVVLKGATFEQFVWGCARAFGALVLMRDDPADAKVPERFEVEPYHATELEKAERELNIIRGLDSAGWQDRYSAYQDKKLTEQQEWKQRDDETTLKYTQMLDKVRAWVPPTSEHGGLKEFMIQQLESSLDFDVVGEKFKPTMLGFSEWKRSELDGAIRHVKYHKEEWEKERRRVEERNAWIAALRKSVPQPATLDPRSES